MRRPRDIDAELKALQERQKLLRGRRTVQLGELVVATGADALDAETLAGALVEIVARAREAEVTEAWRLTGVGFFRRDRRARTHAAGDAAAGPDAHGGEAAPDAGRDAAG